MNNFYLLVVLIFIAANATAQNTDYTHLTVSVGLIISAGETIIAGSAAGVILPGGVSIHYWMHRLDVLHLYFLHLV